MTEADGKYGEELRSALCAAADVVVPVGDGLEKIRARTARRLHALDWAQGYLPYVPQRSVYRLRMAGSWLAAAAAGRADLGGSLRAARDRMGLKPGHHNRKPAQWLRPALAAAGALVIVVAIALAIPRLRDNVAAQIEGNNSSAGTSRPANAAGGPGGGSLASDSSQQLKSGILPALGTKKDPSCSQAASSSSGSGGSSGGASPSGGGTGTATQPGYPPPETGPTGATPGLEGGGGNVGAGGDVDADSARLMLDMPNPDGSTSSVTTYPAPCAPNSTPTTRSVTTPPTTPGTTPVTTPPTTPATSPGTTPVTTPPTSTPPTTPPTSTPPTSPTGDGGGSTAPGPGPGPTQTASPG
jgi:cell division septation protein DedD